MAPRTAKTKKSSTTKVAANEAPKKGRGKAKTVEEPENEAVETEVGDIPTIDKKTKRGKKGEGEANGQEPNGVSEDKAPPAKKGRKKKADIPEENGIENADEDKASHPDDENEAQAESNGQAEEVPASVGRGKKKPVKKEVASKSKTESKPAGRGKKNAKQETESEVLEKEETSEDLVKPAGKGKGRKAPPKADKEPAPENGDDNDKVKESPKKEEKRTVQTKAAKENTPENEQVDEDVDEPAEEPKKKENKGRKNNAKKPAKAEIGEDGDNKSEPASKKRKVAKKSEKDEMKDEELTEEISEPKPAKGKRAQKKEPAAELDEGPEGGDSAGKRRRKAVDEKVSSEDKKNKAPLKNKSSTNYEEIDFSNSSQTVQGKEWNLKISSWNVDGIRAWMSKGGLDYIKYEKPDILCLQEIKCAKDKLPDEIANLPGYHAYWQSSEQDGYAGVGICTTKLAISVQYGLQHEALDAEGRVVTAEYEQFYLVCVYVPNAGRKLVSLPKRLQWNEEFRKYVKALDKKKPVIICGDMNVAHNEIDLTNPKTNKKNAGFTPEERQGMTELLGDGFVDSYRHLHPDETGAYTFWTYMMNSRAKNVGWRLDYFLLSERLLPSLCDNVIRSQVYGSDHCPITLFLHMTSADKPKE